MMVGSSRAMALWLWRTRSRRDRVLHITVILLVAPASIGNVMVGRNFLAVKRAAARCDGLIISDAGPQSSGMVAWPVSQKMPARLSHMGSEPRWHDPTDDLRDDVAVLFMVVAR